MRKDSSLELTRPLLGKLTFAFCMLLICLLLLGGCLGGGSSDSGPGDDPGGDNGGENGDDSGNGDDNDLGSELDDDRFGDRQDDPITEGPLSFESAALVESDAQALDLVEVTGLVEGSQVQELYVEYEIDETDAAIGPGVVSPMTPLIQPDRDEERFYLLVPPHVGETREFRLKVTDGQSYSAALSLMVEPLPEPQAGALDELIEQLESMLRTTAEAYELSYPDDLDAFFEQPGSFNKAFTPLLRAYDAIGNENNPDSLINQDFDEESVELLERIIPHMGLLEDYQALEAFIASDDSLISTAVDALAVNHPQPRNPSYPVAADDGVPLEPIYTIDGPEELSEMMHEYRDARRTLQDIRLAEEIAGDTVSAMSLGAVVFSGGTLTKGAAATKTAAEAILTAVSVGIAAEELALGFYPCCMVDLNLESSPALSGVSSLQLPYEDVEENQLEIQDVLVDLTSDRDIGQELMERMLDIVADRISDQLGDVYSEDSDAGQALIGFGTDELFDQLGLNAEVYFEWNDISITGSEVDKWLNPELEVFGDGSMGPAVWERVTGAAPDDQLHYRLDPERFFGSETSPTVLRVRPDEEKFPMGFWFRMESLPGESNLLFGNRIDVRFDRTIHRVESDEVIELAFAIHHSEDPAFKDLEVTEGEILDIEEVDEGRWEVSYQAPSAVDEDFQAEMTLLADADGGVRHPDNNPAERQGRAYILGESDEEWLRLSGAGCLEPEETVTVMADVNPQDEELEWDSSAGHINPSDSTHKAVFTATVNTGDVEVSATAPDSGQSATTVIPVRESCTCVASIETNQGNVIVEDPGHGMAAGHMDLFMQDGVWGLLGVTDEPSEPLENMASFFFTPQFDRSSGMAQGGMNLQLDEYTVVSTMDDHFEIYWDHDHRMSIRYSGAGMWMYFDMVNEPQGGYTPVNILLRPRIIDLPSEVEPEALGQAMVDAASGAETVIDHGDYFEHLPTGATWTNCD